MPGLDRSGPMGAGPMTGGRKGLCSRSGDVAAPPATGGYGYGRGRGFGGCAARGFGPGRGRGRSFRGRPWGYPPAISDDGSTGNSEELNMLKAEAVAMRKSLEAVCRRIENLEQGKAPD